MTRSGLGSGIGSGRKAYGNHVIQEQVCDYCDVRIAVDLMHFRGA